MTGTLYICATPIGNLEDITYRLARVLKEVDYILAEDTRVTLKILNHLQIHTKLISYHEHSSSLKQEKIIEELLSGKNYALVSDAGTPCVSDPGAKIVWAAVSQGIQVIPVVGPSAFTGLLSVFGMLKVSSHFWGFLPIKNKKIKNMLDLYRQIDGIHIFFESPFRILKTLEQYFLDWDDYHFVIGREMTKQFEVFYRGSCRDVIEQLKKQPIKGEFVVGLAALDKKAAEEDE